MTRLRTRWRWSDTARPEHKGDWVYPGEDEVRLPPGCTRIMQLNDTETDSAVLVAYEFEGDQKDQHPGVVPDEDKARLIELAPELLDRLSALLAAVKRGEVLVHHVRSAERVLAAAKGETTPCSPAE